jgi:FlaA1/EpsC-like NDP-sugar epimerase
MIDGKSILITGCGSLAKALTKHMLLHFKPKKIVLFSRDEYLQAVTVDEIPDPKHVLRYFIGDVRDLSRLSLAMKGIDTVIHTAALKRVDTVEYNPLEAVKTNVHGTENVMMSCVSGNVQNAVFVSTDKAVMPINLYGCTKAVGEKLWLHANFYKPIFNAVRYGNVMGSRGSVLPYFRELAKKKEVFPITSLGATRFWVEMDEAVKLILLAMGGEPGYIHVLKSPTFKVVDLAKALYMRAKIEEVGLRPGEKIHEMLISTAESRRVIDKGDHYLIESEIKFSEEVRPETKSIYPLDSSQDNMLQADIRELLKEG